MSSVYSTILNYLKKKYFIGFGLNTSLPHNVLLPTMQEKVGKKFLVVKVAPRGQ